MKHGTKRAMTDCHNVSGAKSEAVYRSADGTRECNALDLEASVFALNDPSEISSSLKRSAEASGRRESPPYLSAMSTPTFYINKAGKNLTIERKGILERAQAELPEQFEGMSNA